MFNHQIEEEWLKKYISIYILGLDNFINIVIVTVSAIGTRAILMTGRNTLKMRVSMSQEGMLAFRFGDVRDNCTCYVQSKDFGPVFFVHWMPGAGKRDIEVIDKGTSFIIL